MMQVDRTSAAPRTPASAFTPKASVMPKVTASRPSSAANTGLGRQFKVLQNRGAPAQLSLFQRPAGR